MGYTPTIGERFEYEDGSAGVVVIDHLDEAPLDSCSMEPGYEGRGNYCAPSYRVWGNFARAAGVYELWFGPGSPYSEGDSQVTPITPERLALVDEAMQNVEALSESNQRRLRWMHWWMHWAYENCTNPAYS